MANKAKKAIGIFPSELAVFAFAGVFKRTCLYDSKCNLHYVFNFQIKFL